MEKVINVLYEIEERANRILDRTAEQKTQLYQQLNEDLAKLESDIKAQTNSKLTIMRNAMETEITTERTALMNDCNQQLLSMENNFLTNKDQLVQKVFQHITSI